MIIVPPGSMLDPVAPAAVVAGNVETSQCIVDALYGALGLQAASQGTMNNFTFGNERYQYYETIAGGAGAGPDFDGASGVQTHMTNSRLTDPEVLESRFPVLLREFSLRADSGGDGRHRGGDGLVRRVEFREAMTASDAVESPAHRAVRPGGGRARARPGATRSGARRARSETLAATVELAVEPGDQIQIETPGGGGFGPRDLASRLTLPRRRALRAPNQTTPARACVAAPCRRANSGPARQDAERLPARSCAFPAAGGARRPTGSGCRRGHA